MLSFNEVTLQFAPQLRERWKEGELVDEWAIGYPFLFDTDSWRNARGQHQNGYHFVEWFSAVWLFKKKNCYSLVEKYTRESQTWKRAMFERLVRNPEDQEFLSGIKRPDLLVYAKDRSAYCFAEVKGPKDRFGPGQPPAFKEITYRLHVPVVTIRLRKCTENGCTRDCCQCVPAGSGHQLRAKYRNLKTGRPNS